MSGWQISLDLRIQDAEESGDAGESGDGGEADNAEGTGDADDNMDDMGAEPGMDREIETSASGPEKQEKVDKDKENSEVKKTTASPEPMAQPVFVEENEEEDIENEEEDAPIMPGLEDYVDDNHDDAPVLPGLEDYETEENAPDQSTESKETDDGKTQETEEQKNDKDQDNDRDI